MNFADVWNTPGYFYALGYTLGAAIVLCFDADRRHVWRGLVSLAVLAAFLIPFSIATKGVIGLPFVMSMVVMIAAILGCVFLNVRDRALALFDGIKAFIYGEFAASLCWQVYYGLALNRPALQQWAWRAAVMTVAFALIAGVYVLLERSLHKGESQPAIVPRDLAIEALIAASVYVVSNLGYLDDGSLFSGSYARDIFAIRTVVDLSGVAMIYALHSQLVEVQLRLERDALQNIMEMQYQSYRLSRESIDVVNQKYHDLKHQIALLRSQDFAGGADAYLDRMEREIQSYEAQNQTGNKVLDAILTSKALYCQNHGIELKFMVNGALLDFMDDMEISALFGNMLDNAIEGVERIDAPEKRLIRLYVDSEKGFLRIAIENYCEEIIRFKDGLPVTNKRDKRLHGFGMKSMQRTVDRYGGSMMASQEDNWFQLKILIPIKA